MQFHVACMGVSKGFALPCPPLRLSVCLFVLCAMGLSLVRAEQNALRKLFCAALTTMSVVKRRRSIMSCGASIAAFPLFRRIEREGKGEDNQFCIFSQFPSLRSPLSDPSFLSSTSSSSSLVVAGTVYALDSRWSLLSPPLSISISLYSSSSSSLCEINQLLSVPSFSSSFGGGTCENAAMLMLLLRAPLYLLEPLLLLVSMVHSLLLLPSPTQ